MKTRSKKMTNSQMEAALRKRLLIILYFGFVSLGLPDTVLGVAWPKMRLTFEAPLEMAGLLISLTTILSVFSSLSTGWLMKRWNAGKILTICAFTTALAMLGYGLAPSAAVVAGFTILFGLGQGAVDTAVNSFMSRHYSSRQMNWIHGCWGVGATGGPLVFTAVFALGLSWRAGYLTIFVIQMALGLFFLTTLKLWPNDREADAAKDIRNGQVKPASNKASAGKKSWLGAASGVAFYVFYPGVEVVTGLWGASYLVEVLNCEASTAGAAVAMYWASLTAGRFLVGFVADKFENAAIMRGGLAVASIGIAIIFFTASPAFFFAALAFIGLGLSPLYPTMMHETPQRAGAERLELVTGFQVGAALAGTAVVPALTGFLARHLSLEVLPWVLMVFAAMLILTHEVSARASRQRMTKPR
ncbi:MFS transporter [Deltaproteobacteria bacterium Smac51]|nr:MFS transporter [Deltaproteobacteria bacterium Smac51]